MRLVPPLPIGFKWLPMLVNFAVLNVRSLAQSLNRLGLIGDRPFILRHGSANGKSFISATVDVPGGHGAAIALLLRCKLAKTFPPILNGMNH
jgi:hypothetical protein